MRPQRIQRKRTQHWRMPDNAKYVGRGTKWGNPFVLVGAYVVQGPGEFDMHHCAAGEARGVAVRLYREHLMDGRLVPDLESEIEELRGWDLACWCRPGQVCHADVLLEIANRP